MDTKLYSKLISCLGTGWEIKKISNLVQLLVSIFSLFTKIFCRFSGIFLKRRHLKNLKKSANKFKGNKKFNIMILTK